MSVEKKVWVTEFKYSAVPDRYLGASFGDVYDYREYRLNKLKLQKKEDPELRAYNHDIETKAYETLAVGDFNKYPVNPDKLWIDKDERKKSLRPLEKMFRIGIGLVLSESYAEVFQQFRLGETSLTPVQIYELESGELWLDRQFYYLRVSEKRQYMLPPTGDLAQAFRYSSGFNNYRSQGLRDGEVTVSASALGCDIDLWHDPLLRDSHFLSDALARALFKLHPKFKKDGLYSCIVA